MIKRTNKKSLEQNKMYLSDYGRKKLGKYKYVEANALKEGRERN